jgi:hypothetical protein
MSKSTFIWGYDHNGHEGWVMKGMPHFDTTEPSNFAHDCLEHFPGGMKHGAVADEMMAVGARLWLRVASDYWGNQPDFGDATEIWTDEVATQLAYIHERRTPEPKAPRKRRVLDLTNSKMAELEDIIATSTALGQAVFNAEQESTGGPFYVPVHAPIIDHMADWMRIGVLAAVERYHELNNWMVWRGDALDKAVLALNNENREHGDRLTIIVNESNAEVSARLYHVGALPDDYTNLL